MIRFGRKIEPSIRSRFLESIEFVIRPPNAAVVCHPNRYGLRYFMATRWYQLTLRDLLIIVAILGGLCALLSYSISVMHDRWTCALCRQMRVNDMYFDLKWRTWRTVESETACTQWYRDHVEPTHNHVWVHARATAMRNLNGTPFGVIDREPLGRTIWQLSAEDQVSIYEHFTDPIEARDLFLSLTSPNSQTNNQDYVIMRSLQDWKDSGFQGPCPSAAAR